MSSTKVLSILVFVCVAVVSAQRGSYAGQRPGTFNTAASTGTASVGDRFGETGTTANGVTTTTQRLPYDAYGDAGAVQLGLAAGEAHRPFWLLNQAAIEAHRGGENRPPVAAGGVINRFGEPDLNGFDLASINKISQSPVVYPVNAAIPSESNNVQQRPIESVSIASPPASTVQPQQQSQGMPIQQRPNQGQQQAIPVQNGPTQNQQPQPQQQQQQQPIPSQQRPILNQNQQQAIPAQQRPIQNQQQQQQQQPQQPQQVNQQQQQQQQSQGIPNQQRPIQISRPLALQHQPQPFGPQHGHYDDEEPQNPDLFYNIAPYFNEYEY